MTSGQIKYKEGYKYQLVEDYEHQTSIFPQKDLVSPSGFIKLKRNGLLWIKSGYAWDGPSGPTIDTKNFMRGSLVHDALYQLMREKLLDHEMFRELADAELKKTCLEDGMWKIRAMWVYEGVHFCGDPSADPDNDRPVITAP